jgi:hypothetical protein
VTHPETDPARMQRRVNDVVQPKNLAPLVGKSANQVAKWGRDPADHDADATGCPGPLEHVRTYFRVLAIHGAEGRACAVELREWLCREADDALGITEPTTTELRLNAVAETLRETGEAAAAAVKGDRDPADAQREIAEAIASLQKLGRIVAAQAPALKAS